MISLLAGVCSALLHLDKSSYAWCKSQPWYYPVRDTSTTYMQNKHIKIGISRTMGGTVMQLYDKSRDRNLLSEHGGAAMQLSLWGYGELTGWPCQPGTPLEGVLNPIQAQGRDCQFNNKGNDAKLTWIDQYTTFLEKQGPYNFTRSVNVPDLKWNQRIFLSRRGYANITYHVEYGGEVLPRHPQEMPALFLSLGKNPHIYWAGYKEPYEPTSKIIREDLVDGESIVLSRGLSAYSPATRVMSSGWYSVCSQDEKHCVTVMLGTENPLVRQVNIGWDSNSSSTYATPMGWEELGNMDWNVIVVAMKYDKALEIFR